MDRVFINLYFVSAIMTVLQQMKQYYLSSQFYAAKEKYTNQSYRQD